MSASQVSTTNEGHNKIWFTHDGLLMHYTAELIAGCKEHRDPRNAVKLYNNLISTAWARVPSEMRDSRFGLRKEVLYEKHVADFVVETLQDLGHQTFANRISEERKKPLPPPRPIVPPKPAAPQQQTVRPPPVAPQPAAAGSNGVGRKSPVQEGASAAGGKRPADGLTSGGSAPKQAKVMPMPMMGAAASPGGGKDEDCGQCINCLDKIKFGGPGTRKQSCVNREKIEKAAPGFNRPAKIQTTGMGSSSGAAASAAAKVSAEPDDTEVARAMLVVLRKAAAPLSFAQVASTAKDNHPHVLWNTAKWLQAVQRGLKARPNWFANIGGEMLGVGPEAGIEPTNAAPEEKAAAAAVAPDRGVALPPPPSGALIPPPPPPGGPPGGAPVSGGPGLGRPVASGGPGVKTGGPGAVASGGPGFRPPATGGPGAR